MAEQVPMVASDNSFASVLASLNRMTRLATAWVKQWIPGDAPERVAAIGPKAEIVTADAATADSATSREERLREEVAKRRAEADRQIQEGLKKLEEFEAARKAREEAQKREAEAKAKADEAAKAKADAEAKAKSEADAKARLEAEARAKADEEARARDQALAKAKDEAEARAREEALAAAKAAEDAKAKAEADRLQTAEVVAAPKETPAAEAKQGSPGPSPAPVARAPENELKPAQSFAFAETAGGQRTPEAANAAEADQPARPAAHAHPGAKPNKVKVQGRGVRAANVVHKRSSRSRSAGQMPKLGRALAPPTPRDMSGEPYVVVVPPHEVICVSGRRMRGLF